MGAPKIIQPREFEALLRNATPQTLPAFVLGGFTGLRMGEIMNLHWNDVDFKRNVIMVYGGKYSSSRMVSLPDAAAAWLCQIAKDSGKVINLPSLRMIYNQMRQVWGETKCSATPHSLRYSAMAYRLELDGETQTAGEFGFSIKLLVALFRRLVTKRHAKAWFAIFPPNKV